MLCNQDILFLHIPKTGGMAVTDFLLKVIPKPIYYAVPKGHASKINDSKIIISVGSRHGNLENAQEWVTNLGRTLDSFKKIITIIRNPYEMEVSRYFYLKLGHPWDQGKAQKIALESDFETFAVTSPYLGRKLSEIEKYFLIDGIQPSNMAILRQENLATDLNTVLEASGIKVTQKLPIRNQTKHSHYRDYLTPKSEAAIYQRFQWVFDSGFYPREQFLR